MLLAKGGRIVDIPSNHSVDQTVEKLMAILEVKDVSLFALVDHSGEAEKVGMKMRPTKLLIFGSRSAGTPLMLAAGTDWDNRDDCDTRSRGATAEIRS